MYIEQPSNKTSRANIFTDVQHINYQHIYMMNIYHNLSIILWMCLENKFSKYFGHYF